MHTESLRAYIPLIIVCSEHAAELRKETTYFSVCVSGFEFACKNSRTAKRVVCKICTGMLTDILLQSSVAGNRTLYEVLRAFRRSCRS
jgi:hypothetical protein